jgi:thioredoxin-like negative regulator of GroEL
MNLQGGMASEVAKAYGIRYVPRYVVVDAEGKVVEAFASKPGSAELNELLNNL